MRKFIIDTDTGSDDAVALALAALSDDIEILGVTAVAGNVGMEQAALNAKQVLEVCGRDIAVYPGAKKPLMCDGQWLFAFELCVSFYEGCFGVA